MMGNYRPDLMPGGSTGRPDVDTSTQPQRTVTLSPIESRLRTIQANSTLLNVDSTMRAFFMSDVPYLMRIARAAERWALATQAEEQRRAADELQAAVRNP